MESAGSVQGLLFRHGILKKNHEKILLQAIYGDRDYLEIYEPDGVRGVLSSPPVFSLFISVSILNLNILPADRSVFLFCFADGVLQIQQQPGSRHLQNV